MPHIYNENLLGNLEQHEYSSLKEITMHLKSSAKADYGNLPNCVMFGLIHFTVLECFTKLGIICQIKNKNSKFSQTLGKQCISLKKQKTAI